MSETMLKVSHISKQYKLGQIGGTTLREELQRWGAKMRHQEDPTKKIGAADYVAGETFMALDDVSFSVKKGERVGIIGHNGAGKSTLLKLISRITAPTDGDIWMNGRVASMLEVGTGFHGELTGRENIYMNGAILGMSKKEIDAKMEDIIEFSECRQFIDTPVKRYSSGMYVKLAFSVAAHLDSEIMIMDEVLAVGDMAFQNKCLEKMSDVSKEDGRTILYVSHNMSTIRRLCDRCIVLNHGKIIFDGDVESGIELYLGISKDAEYQTEYDFTNNRRRFHFGKEIFVESFHFTGVEEAEFKVGSKINMEITLNSKINRDEVRVIIRIKDRQNIRLIAGCLSEGVSIHEGRQTLAFSMDSEGIMPDIYCFSIEVIQYNRSGEYYSYDNPDAMMSVRFDQGDMDERWPLKYWGNIRLNDMRVIYINYGKADR